MLTKIQGAPHPKHYLMHKYWGRKAHNLVAEYVKYYTKRGDTVLDPFMGSGGAIIESKKIGRKSIGIDINPITRLIVENTVNDIDPQLLRDGLDSIIDAIPNDVKELSLTLCPICNTKSELKNAIWDSDDLVRVKGFCKEHKQFVKDADEFDRKLAALSTKLFNKYVKTDNLFYPKDRILDFVRRNGKKYIDELFSDRNLLQSAYILHQISKIRDKKKKNFFEMAFTSMLPNVSNMIPANEKSATGKSGWQISKFWVPKCHTEKNVFNSFESRVKAICNAKNETNGIFSDASYEVHIRSSEDMSFLPDSCVDYIFTDPPYADSIAYLGLSMFWNSWLKYKVEYDSEIIHDPYRKKDHHDYSVRLSKVFNELFRVLKPGKAMSFTFHNRHLKFWKIVLDAVSASGFELEDIAWHQQAVPSGTQGINQKNTLRGDFVYTFKKPVRAKTKQGELFSDTPGETIILNEVAKLFNNYEFIETAVLYETVIPPIIRQRAFLDNQGKILNIEKVLSENFRYEQVALGEKIVHGWVKS